MDAIKTGGLIAQARKGKELTQKDLAEALHVSTQAVSKWENGRSCPDIALLEPLAEALDLTVTELLSGQRGEEPGEEAVRDSLRFGENQLRPKIRRWRWLFLLAAVLLLAVLAGLGWIWVRDNTELLPQRETVIRGLPATEREFALVQVSGEAGAYLYQVDLADSMAACSFQWELWSHNGLEQSWDAGGMGDLSRQSAGRHQLLAVTFSKTWQVPDLTYGIMFLGNTLGTTLEKVPYLDNAMAVSPLEQRISVDPEEGVVLLALTLNTEGKFYMSDMAHAADGRVGHLPEDENTAHLLLKMYCG